MIIINIIMMINDYEHDDNNVMMIMNANDNEHDNDNECDGAYA
jgi:hypothetical protein